MAKMQGRGLWLLGFFEKYFETYHIFRAEIIKNDYIPNDYIIVSR